MQNPLVPYVGGRGGFVAVDAPLSESKSLIVEPLALLAFRGERAAIVVCDNVFDLDAIAAKVKAWGGERSAALQCLLIARTETSHQVRHRLQQMVAEPMDVSAVFVSGVLHPFLDEHLRPQEQARLLADALAAVRILGERTLVFVTAYTEKRWLGGVTHVSEGQHLLKQVRDAADAVITVEEPMVVEATRHQRLLRLKGLGG